MGLLLNYGTNFSDKDIAHFFEEIKSNQFSRTELQEFFFNYFDENQNAFLKTYTTGRKPVDLRFSESKEKGDQISFRVEEKNNFRPPFSIGLVKNDSLIKQYNYTGDQLNTHINIATEQADYMVINPTTKLPEFNPRNNWKKLGGLGIKPLRLTFVKDLENPQYNQVFYNPRMDFNVYNGLSFGVRLNNKTIKSRPFIFNLEPFYSTLEKSLVGTFATSYSLLNSDSDYYLTKFNFAGSSFHYDTNLRYSSLFTSINILKEIAI